MISWCPTSVREGKVAGLISKPLALHGIRPFPRGIGRNKAVRASGLKADNIMPCGGWGVTKWYQSRPSARSSVGPCRDRVHVGGQVADELLHGDVQP